MKILIVEDDPNIADVLERGLRGYGFDVDAVLDGEEGLAWALRGEYDLVVLDVKLPKLNGNEVCLAVRQNGLTMPIIMLSALSAPSDTNRSMELGANAYIVKPFEFEALVDCIRSLTGGEERNATTIAASDLLLDLTNQKAFRAGAAIDLTAHEFELLKYFILNKGERLTHEMICEHVLQARFDPRSNVVDMLVRLLQRKIDAGREDGLIEVVPEMGYRFNAQ